MTRQVEEAEVRRQLRSVRFPGYSRDIVSFGFVRNVSIDGGAVTILFAPDTNRTEKVEQMEREIHDTLHAVAGVTSVRIERRSLDDVAAESGTLTPLQAELLTAGTQPDVDPLGNDPRLRKIDLAPGAGYGEEGPAPLNGPGGSDRRAVPERGAPDTAWRGAVPVYQWDIDPNDAAAIGGEAQVTLDDWDFNLWWQVHPCDLVYVSIQAVREDLAGDRADARRHPVGRAVAVNLVYDAVRRGVVAVYGTARDFRPFVEAFRIGFGLPGEHAPGQQEDRHV